MTAPDIASALQCCLLTVRTVNMWHHVVTAVNVCPRRLNCQTMQTLRHAYRLQLQGLSISKSIQFTRSRYSGQQVS